VAVGPFYGINVIFTLADIATGLMAIANLIGVVGLRKIVIENAQILFD
jgi:AGCS family alanine or glycine:cation symporter